MPQSTQAQLSGVAPLRSILLMPRRFYARRSSRACCHSRFARTVMPNRRGDSCTLWRRIEREYPLPLGRLAPAFRMFGHHPVLSMTGRAAKRDPPGAQRALDGPGIPQYSGWEIVGRYEVRRVLLLLFT